MKAIILAAGYATRLYPLTKTMPKALLPIGGRPMLTWFYENLAATGAFDGVVLVTNERYHAAFLRWGEEARSRFPQLPLTILSDGTKGEEERLGAMGDVQFALEHAHIDDDVLLAASDNFITFSLAGFVKEFARTGRDTLLAWHMPDYEDRKNMAIATIDETGKVLRLHEKPEKPETDIALFALYLYTRQSMGMLSQFLSEGNNGDSPGRYPAWLYSRRDMGVWFFPGECVDIGTPAHLEAVGQRFACEEDVLRELDRVAQSERAPK